jgi:flagellar biosynthesis protein FlhG
MVLAYPSAAPDGGPITVVVSGGQPGAGATTLAVRLAAALANDALRVVLIDADLHQANVAARCGLAGSLGLGDVVAGKKSIHEALQRGPCGLQVLSGTATAETRAAVSERSIRRLTRQLRSLAKHTDWLIIDAGHEPSLLTARLWSLADRVLLVTSPDAAAVMDTYVLTKTLLAHQSLSRPIELVVNQTASAAQTADVFRRIDQSCRRFLGLGLELAGGVPHDPALAAGIGEQRVPELADAAGTLADAVGRLARRLTAAPRAIASHKRKAA